jgi:hypothetical protein
MNTVLAWVFLGAAVVGIASGADFVATVMRDLFHRQPHA